MQSIGIWKVYATASAIKYNLQYLIDTVKLFI